MTGMGQEEPFKNAKLNDRIGWKADLWGAGFLREIDDFSANPGTAVRNFKGDAAPMAAIEPEAVFVEVGLDVFSAKAVVDAEPPPLQPCEDAVHLGQDDMRRHESDGLRGVRVAEPGQIDIAQVVVG